MADVVDPNAPAFAELDELLGKGQYRAAGRKADDILKNARGDVDALRCKAYALMCRSKFSDVLSVASGMADEELKFYGAYAHYKLNNFSEALKQITSLRVKAKTDATMELKGQILYKQGNFNQAKLTFEQCITQYNVRSVNVKTNLLAALVASGTSEQVEELMQKYGIGKEDGFEITFNVACNHIAMGNYETAMELLEVALRAGQESLMEEELTPAEVEVELLPVAVQLNYVRGLRGSATDYVHELVESGNKTGIGMSIKYVIENNVLAANSLLFSDHPPKRFLYESAKKLEKMLSGSSVPLLSPAQRVLVACNQALLLIALNHMDDARPIVEQLLDDHPAHETVKMTQAVLLAKQNKLREAADLLHHIIAEHDTLVLTPMLFRAQLLCTGGSSKEALKLLISIQDEKVKFVGSMVATKIALMEQVSDYDGCRQLLDASLTWWRGQAAHRDAAADVAIAWCLQKYADILLKQGDLAQAVDYCKQALEIEQDELRRHQLISKFAKIVASSTVHEEMDFASLLPEGPSLEDEDVDDLEGNIKGIKRGEVSAKKRQQTAENGQVTKRKRKPRYPKGFDPANPGPAPDPERWLPKWQRRGHKKKQSARRDAVKGSQGAGKVDESLDFASHKSEGSSVKPPPSGRSGPRRKGHRR